MNKAADQKSIKKKFQEKFVVKTFSDQAEIYAGKYSDKSSIAHSFSIRRQRVYKMLEGLKEGKVLDIGCGPGIMVEHLVNKGIEFYGVDLSKKMIEQCKQNFRHIPSAHFSVGRIEKIEFPDSFFDVVICMGVVEYIKNDKVAIKEMVRVVKPGGVIIITLPNKLSLYRLWGRRVYSNFTRLIKWIIRYKAEEAIIHREYTENAYCNLLKSFNLKIVDVVYYNFKLLLYPLDKLLPGLTVLISRKLEFLCRSKLRWLGTGFIVKAKK